MENSRFDWVFLNVSLFKNRYRCQVYVGFGIGYRYRYRFFKVISITSVSKTYRIIGNIPINRYRYGSISKNWYWFGKSPSVSVELYCNFLYHRQTDGNIRQLTGWQPCHRKYLKSSACVFPALSLCSAHAHCPSQSWI